MRKINKKLAGIVAAAMTLSTMGAFSAFADFPIDESSPTTPAASDDTTDKTGTIGLKITPYEGTHTNATPTTNTDADDHIWVITANVTELSWNIARSTNGGTYDVVWNPTNHRYQGVGKNDETTTFALYDSDTATKTVTVTNNSNFAVEYSAAITSADTTKASNDDVDDIFTMGDGENSGTIPVYSYDTNGGNTISTNVTIHPNLLTDEIWSSFGLSGTNETTNHDSVNIGTLTYTFSVPNIGGTPVSDASNSPYHGNQGS